MTQAEEDKTQTKQEIAPRQVWLLLTDKQQAQFIQSMEIICQGIARRLMRLEEGNDANN